MSACCFHFAIEMLFLFFKAVIKLQQLHTDRLGKNSSSHLFNSSVFQTCGESNKQKKLSSCFWQTGEGRLVFILSHSFNALLFFCCCFVSFLVSFLFRHFLFYLEKKLSQLFSFSVTCLLFTCHFCVDADKPMDRWKPSVSCLMSVFIWRSVVRAPKFDAEKLLF